MSNEYYSNEGFPTPNSRARSADMRAELEKVQQGFNKLPPLAGKNGFLVKVNADASGLEALPEGISDATQAALDLKTPRTSATGAAVLPAGTQAQRPAPVAGQLRFNTDLNEFEGHNGTDWGTVGGGATGAPGNAAFYENDINVTGDYTITTNRNAMSAGPITVNNGVTVTVPVGSVWSVI